MGWLHQLTDALHLLAGGFWIGALVLLALLLRTPPPRELLLRLSSRFSALGVFAVVLVVATGALNALFIVPDWGHFLGSAYGRTLVGKIMPVAAMILLAVVNRSLLTPRIRTVYRQLRICAATSQLKPQSALWLSSQQAFWAHCLPRRESFTRCVLAAKLARGIHDARQ